jgi:hypothetical protein
MSRRPAFFWWVAALGAVLLLCYVVAGIELWRYDGTGKQYGWAMAEQGGRWHVTVVLPGDEAAGRLRLGDRQDAVNGMRGPTWLLVRLVLLVPAGSTYVLSVNRGGVPLDLPLRVRKTKGSPYWGAPLQFGASLACFAVALLMGLSKPWDRTVQYACLTFLGLAAMHLMRTFIPNLWSLDWQARPAYMVLGLVDPLPVATGYLFASRFPKKLPAGRWWKAVAVLVCAGTRRARHRARGSVDSTGHGRRRRREVYLFG